MGDIVEHIDSVLAAGEPDPAPVLCPHCGEEWHGLPVTQRMRDMARRGYLDDGYRYSDDGSEVLCPGAGVDAVMVRRPAPCDCDLCSGRFEAFMHSLGMRRIASIDPGDPTAAAIIVAALAATQGLIEDMLGPQFRVGFG